MNITNEAQELILSILNENNAEGIRVYLAGMGWGGPKLGLALDEPEEKDIVETINGIKVAIDSMVVQETENLTLDRQDSPEGAGLVMLGNESNCC